MRITLHHIQIRQESGPPNGVRSDWLAHPSLRCGGRITTSTWGCPDPEACLGGLETEFKECTEKAPLADWIKLEAFKVFVMPKLDYAFRSTLAHRKWAIKLDRFVRTTVKWSSGLPICITDAFFYVPTSKGGLGLRSIEDELGNQMVTQCIKMLSSPDDFVTAASLDAMVLKKYRQTKGPEDRWRFLSAQLKAPLTSPRSSVM